MASVHGQLPNTTSRRLSISLIKFKNTSFWTPELRSSTGEMIFPPIFFNINELFINCCITDCQCRTLKEPYLLWVYWSLACTQVRQKKRIYPCVRCSYGELDVHPFVLAGKIGDRPSGIYPQPDTTEFPTEDILLIAMERVTVLFDRYAKTQFYTLQ